MISVGVGFSIGSKLPIDDRFLLTKDEMLNINENTQPDNYFCICSDDGNFYIYNVANTPDPETGKFKLLSGGSGESYTLPIATDTVLGGVMVDGLTINVDENGVITGIDTYDKTEIDDKLSQVLPAYSIDEAGKILSVSEDGTTVEWIDRVDAVTTDKVVQDLTVPSTDTILSTEGLNTILDTKVDKVENHSLVADEDIAKIHEHTNLETLEKFSENEAGELLYDGNLVGGSGDSALADWTTNITIGNLTAGFDLTDKSPLEILRLITVAYVNPSARITFTGGNATNKKGSSFDLTVALADVSGGDNPVSEMILYVDSVPTETLPYVEGTTAYTFATININATTTVEVKVYDTERKTVGSSKTYSFVNPYYYGVTDEVPVDASGLTELIEVKGNKAITYDADGQHVVFMYDKTYGKLSSILDPSGFECKSGFTETELVIDEVAYYCYYSTLKQVVENFKYTYKL